MSETRHYGPGSDAGARRWAIANALIQTGKLNKPLRLSLWDGAPARDWKTPLPQ